MARLTNDMESLAGVTAASMADEVIAKGAAMRMTDAAAGLAKVPLLALTSDDGLKPNTVALVEAITAKGGSLVTAAHVATDHSWSDRRIRLQQLVLEWLATLP